MRTSWVPWCGGRGAAQGERACREKKVRREEKRWDLGRKCTQQFCAVLSPRQKSCSTVAREDCLSVREEQPSVKIAAKVAAVESFDPSSREESLEVMAVLSS